LILSVEQHWTIGRLIQNELNRTWKDYKSAEYNGDIEMLDGLQNTIKNLENLRKVWDEGNKFNIQIQNEGKQW